MIRYVVGFLVIAIILGLFGFGGAAGMSMNAAWIVGLLLIAFLIIGWFGGNTPPVN